MPVALSRWPLAWKIRKITEKSRKEFKTGEWKRQGKCVLACGQLPRVLFLTQHTQERSSLLHKVLHIEHSCHSYERIYK